MNSQNPSKDKLRQEREARLAAELRASLRKRKEQARRRRSAEDNATAGNSQPESAGLDE